MSRLRRLLRSVRRAPWGAAAPLAIVMSVVLAVGLVVADGGGWRSTIIDFGIESGAMLLGIGDAGVVGIYYYDDGAFGIASLLGESAALFLLFTGGLFVAIFGLLAIAATSRGRRLAAVAFVVFMGVALAGWTGLTDARLGYTTVMLREARSPSTGAGELAVGISMSAVVALLLGGALLVAAWWSVAERRSRRRGAPTQRPAWGASARVLLIAVLVTLPLPRVGRWLRDAGRSAFGEPSTVVDAVDAGGQQTVYLFVAAAVALGLLATLAARRAPALALAAVIVMAALWLPSGWIVGGLLPDALVGSGLAILVFWAAWIAAGTLAALTIASRTTPEPNPT